FEQRWVIHVVGANTAQTRQTARYVERVLETGELLLAPQVGFEPTTLRLTVAAASIDAGCCDCLPSTEARANQGFGAHARLLGITAIFYWGSFAFPFDRPASR